MRLTVFPGSSLSGNFGPDTVPGLPGDKSISHRAALFAAMARGESTVTNFMVSGVTRVLLEAISQLGVTWQLEGTTLHVISPGFRDWNVPEQPLDCGNSGTTMRLLAGALAAAGIPAILDGSPGLRRRPMSRLISPLQQMGVPINGTKSGSAPLKLKARDRGSKLTPIFFDMPVPSAQVKTCLLLAALSAPGETTLQEHYRSRDHTEILLTRLGVNLSAVDQSGPFENRIVMKSDPDQDLKPLNLHIPGDFSSAAFLIVAGLITPQSRLTLTDIGLNPTRTGLLDVLSAMGARVEIIARQATDGEARGDLFFETSTLLGTQVSGRQVVRMIDEFPILAVAAAYARGTTTVRQAEELRYKESDRITALCTELNNVGASVAEFTDGFAVTGNGRLRGGTVQPHRDHRLALSLGVAGLAAEAPIIIEDAEIIKRIFPYFPTDPASSQRRTDVFMTSAAEIRLGLVGYPLTHSLSPLLHQAALQSTGLAGSYSLWEFQPDQFDRQFTHLTAGLQAGRIIGINVTIPYKQKVVPYLERLTPECQAIGAVNTIYYDHGKLIGENTDARGFLRSLDRLAAPFDGRRALVFGSGGAARAVVYSLLQRSWKVFCASRNVAARQAIAEDFRSGSPTGELVLIGMSADEIHSHLEDIELVVNATPLGMHPQTNTTPWPQELDFPPAAVCLDLVYNPPVTSLMRAARKAGGQAENGAWMLVEQAAAAFELWTGQPPSLDSMFQALERHFEQVA